MDKQLVVFELANENFGVEINSVESIIKMQAITRVPQAPDFVVGVTNLRGKVLPVIDLCKRFGLPAAGETKASRIVVVSIAGVEVGMIVDSVSEVLTAAEEIVEQVPTMVTMVDSNFLAGIAKFDERLVILLDLKKVIAIQEEVELS